MCFRKITYLCTRRLLHPRVSKGAAVYIATNENKAVSLTKIAMMVSLYRAKLLTVLILLTMSVAGRAQHANTLSAGHFPRVALKTNLLYDFLVAPNVGLELRPADKWSVAVNAVYGWTDGGPFGDRVRIVTGDAELRYWFRGDAMQRGFHAGAYGAVYRYDFLFGGKGEEAKINWGAGLSCGYTVSLDSHFSLDFSVGIGYIGGKYKSYEVSDDELRHNVWTADKIRHYVGPAKAEVSLVWLLPFGQKGGTR